VRDTGGGSVGEEEARAPGGDRHGAGDFSFRPDAARILAWFVRQREEGEKGNGYSSSCWRRLGAGAAWAGRGGGDTCRQEPGEEGPGQGGGTEERKRRKRKGISQGLVRKFRKLQGPLSKVKFHINLKP
jgi:hypothetical protein